MLETTLTTMASIGVDFLLGFFGLDGIAFAGGDGLGSARLPIELFSLKISSPFKMASLYEVYESFWSAASTRKRSTFFRPPTEGMNMPTT
jgi:hypothetical protein